MTEAKNPFFETWTTPFGVPPFSRIKAEHFMPAFECAFAEHDAEIAAIAGQKESPSFDNTIVALENAGRALARVDDVFGQLVGTDSTDELLQIERDISPRTAAHWNKVRMNEGLFARIDALYRSATVLDLRPNRRACWSVTTPSIAVRAPASIRPRRGVWPRSSSGWLRSAPRSARMCRKLKSDVVSCVSHEPNSVLSATHLTGEPIDRNCPGALPQLLPLFDLCACVLQWALLVQRRHTHRQCSKTYKDKGNTGTTEADKGCAGTKRTSTDKPQPHGGVGWGADQLADNVMMTETGARPSRSVCRRRTWRHATFLRHAALMMPLLQLLLLLPFVVCTSTHLQRPRLPLCCCPACVSSTAASSRVDHTRLWTRVGAWRRRSDRPQRHVLACRTLV